LAIASVIVIRQLRKRSDFAYKMDAPFLRRLYSGIGCAMWPVLQLMEVLGSLMDADTTWRKRSAKQGRALVTGNSTKRARSSNAVRRGEKFSRELERHGDMFPPIVSQLVIVGEQTGNAYTCHWPHRRSFATRK